MAGGGEGHLDLPADFLIGTADRVLAAKHGRFVDDYWSVDELLDLAGKAGRAADPGSSTQCEWALSFVFTVLLGHLRVSMAFQSKYL